MADPTPKREPNTALIYIWEHPQGRWYGMEYNVKEYRFRITWWELGGRYWKYRLKDVEDLDGAIDRTQPFKNDRQQLFRAVMWGICNRLGAQSDEVLGLVKKVIGRAARVQQGVTNLALDAREGRIGITKNR